jgi:hypothetical protein
MQEHQTAYPERRSHLLRKASTSVHVSSKLREGALLRLFPGLNFHIADHSLAMSRCGGHAVVLFA